MGWHTGWHMPGREKHEVLKRALHGESRGAPGSTRMVSLSKKDYPCCLSVPTEWLLLLSVPYLCFCK